MTGPTAALEVASEQCTLVVNSVHVTSAASYREIEGLRFHIEKSMDNWIAELVTPAYSPAHFP